MKKLLTIEEAAIKAGSLPIVVRVTPEEETRGIVAVVDGVRMTCDKGIIVEGIIDAQRGTFKVRGREHAAYGGNEKIWELLEILPEGE